MGSTFFEIYIKTNKKDRNSFSCQIFEKLELIENNYFNLKTLTSLFVFTYK